MLRGVLNAPLSCLDTCPKWQSNAQPNVTQQYLFLYFSIHCLVLMCTYLFFYVVKWKSAHFFVPMWVYLFLLVFSYFSRYFLENVHISLFSCIIACLFENPYSCFEDLVSLLLLKNIRISLFFCVFLYVHANLFFLCIYLFSRFSLIILRQHIYLIKMGDSVTRMMVINVIKSGSFFQESFCWTSLDVF